MPSDYDLLAMLLLGLTGTGHCLGMCGPLVVAIPGRVGGWPAHLAYHAGRLTTYTLVGALLGSISSVMGQMAGTPETPMIWIARLQIAVSALAALLLLFLGLGRLGFLREPAWLSGALPHGLPGVGGAIARNMQRGTLRSVLILGLILGLLPCGLSYAAFARCLAADGLLDGARLVLAFGLGTLPGLLILGTGVGAIWRRYRQSSEIIAGLIMVGMALSLAVQVAGGG